ncbi:MAG: hypothetical protein ABS36_01345 [Acidobacteria bacterium SCN 69-37]|nr:MAG: hypothetical protein ABS36_01345 [Acidobacteria bacterium SCN 69-37]
MIRPRPWLLAFALVVSATWPALAQQASPQGPWPLAEVHIEGLQRYTADQVIRLSGLTIGQAVRLDQLQQTVNHMAGTGLFARVGFGYESRPGGLVVTMQIEEPVWSVPLVFDNNIWLTDDEFARAMAEQVPGFDGTAVEGGAANDFILAAAQRILDARGIRGRLEILPRFDMATQTMLFTMLARDTTERLRVCTVSFPGASILPARTLTELADPLSRQDYSKTTTAAVRDAVVQAYRQRGHWRAVVDAPVASPSSGACTGLSIALAVTEGAAYDVGGTRWTGTTAVATADLDRALDLRIGSTADSRRLSAGLAAVERLYHAQGYVTMATGVTADFDENARRVTFVIEVREGPQFRMGTLSTIGLSDRQTSDLTRRWRLAAGDVFDGPYYQQFLRAQSERIGGGLRGEARLNPETAIVDVTFSVGG